MRPLVGLSLASVLVIGCFDPSGVEDTEATDGSGGATEAGSGSGSATAPMTSADDGDDDGVVTDGPDPDDGTTMDDPGDTTMTDPSAGSDSTGDVQPECDEPDLPCRDGQYCVAGACADPPEGMVAVPAGTFWMGCEDEADEDCNPDQYPFHEVSLDAFAIDRTEASIDDYMACVEAGACEAPAAQTAFGDACTWDDAFNGTYPITCINWFRAQAFCEWQGKRLPTEAEWEKAARGDDARLYPWGDTAPTCNHAVAANCTMFNVSGGTMPVGSLPLGASPYGALDMAGNVFEWVADWYDAAYYLDSPTENPQGPASGPRRALRSCGFNYSAGAMRAAFRSPDYEVPTQNDANRNVGVRCAISATP